MNNKNILKGIFLIALYLFAGQDQVMAQGQLNVEEVKVIKDFEARLKDFKKVKLEPELPGFDISERSYEYKISSKPLKLEYEKPSIRPLALPEDELESIKSTYLKFGYGLPNAFTGELALGKMKGDFSSSFALRHNSASNKDIVNQKFLTNALDFVIANTFENELKLNANAFMNIDYFNLYGIVAAADTTKQNLSPQRRLMHWDVSAALKRDEITNSMSASIGIRHQFMHNNIEGVNAHMVRPSLDVHLDLYPDFSLIIPVYSTIAFSNFQQKASLVGIKPVFRFSRPFFRLELGADAFYDDKFKIHPEAYVGLNKLFKFLDIFAGVNSEAFINTIYNKGIENPFMLFASDDFRTSVIESYYGGVRADVEGAKIEFITEYRLLENLHMFVPSAVDDRQFDMMYDNGKDLAIKGMFSYNITSNITLSGDLVKHFYTMDTVEKAWHHPDFEASFTSQLSFLNNKLLVDGSLFFKSGLFYPDVNQQAVSLPVLFDISGRVQYKLIDNFSVFLEWNNITATKYNRWYQYPSYRVHLLAGIKAQF
jgi:hypothetical protein